VEGEIEGEGEGQKVLGVEREVLWDSYRKKESCRRDHATVRFSAASHEILASIRGYDRWPLQLKREQKNASDREKTQRPEGGDATRTFLGGL